MSEATRGWIYRLAVLAVVVYIVTVRPDSIKEVLPVLLALLGNGLASLNTRVR